MTNLPVNIPQDFHIHFHLTSQHKSLPQYYTLPVLHPQVIFLKSHQRSLPQLQTISSLNPHVICLPYHHRILPQFHIMNQENLPVLNPQVIHLTYHQKILPQIQIMHKVTLPVDISPFFLSKTQPQCSRNSSTRLKWYFRSLLPALCMHLQPHSSTWSH